MVKCIFNTCEKNVEHWHHIIPRSWDKENQETIPVCTKHHHYIHNILPLWIWKFVGNKEQAKKEIKEKTQQLIKYLIQPIPKEAIRGMRIVKYICPRCNVVLEYLPPLIGGEEIVKIYDCPSCSESFSPETAKKEEIEWSDIM